MQNYENIPINSIFDYYNTPLTPFREADFQIKKYNSPLAFDTGRDYDLRGFYNQYGNLTPQATNGHLTDTYKKPNHPTFSNESMYYTGQIPAVDWNKPIWQLMDNLDNWNRY